MTVRLRPDAVLTRDGDGPAVVTADTRTALPPEAALWLERLAPVLGRGVEADALTGPLDPARQAAARRLLAGLAAAGVLRGGARPPGPARWYHCLTDDPGRAAAVLADAPVRPTAAGVPAEAVRVALARTGLPYSTASGTTTGPPPLPRVHLPAVPSAAAARLVRAAQARLLGLDRSDGRPPYGQGTPAGHKGADNCPAAPSRTLAVLGGGDLARRIAAVAPVGGITGPVLLAPDRWLPSAIGDGRALARRLGMRWLPLRVRPGQLVIGPLEELGDDGRPAPGCVRCAGFRESMIGQGRSGPPEERLPWPVAFAPWLDGLLCGLAADIAAAQSLPRGQRGVDLTRAVAAVGLRDLAVSRHPLVPDPLCPDCGNPPGDSPERARVILRAVPDRGGLRARTLPQVRRALLSTVVDPVVGVVAEIRTATEGGLATATAPFGVRAGTGPEAGYGRAADTETAQTVAVLEALERLGGMVPGGRRSTVRASRDDLGPVAVDPRGFGTHDPNRYARPDFPFTPWDDGRETTWVWAHHMGTGRQVLVPESLAYYRSHALRPDDPGFVHDTSSGCAVGSCVEEAVLFGLLEVAERDAFLLRHYTRLPAVEIDLETVPDASFRRTAARITASTGYRLRAFDLSVDHAVPCACVVVQDPGGGRGRPALLCSAAAHPDPAAALNSAAREAGPLLDHLRGVYARNPGRAAELAADPEQVRRMPDHALRYAHTDAFDRLAHLVDNGSAPVDLASAFAGRRTPAGETLDVHVRDMVGRFASCGMDVLVVDQTTAEHAAAGLRCVRVLVPGAVPMTFGHGNRRVHGLPRLLTVPSALSGEHGARPRRRDLNPDPHPFP